MTRAVVARSASELHRLLPSWERLYRSAHATCFQSFAWNSLAARVFAGREHPYVVFAESGGGAALIPAVLRQDGNVALIGDSMFDYRDVLAEGDESVLAAAWAKVAELGRSLSVLALRGRQAAQQWAAFRPQPFCQAPMVCRAQTCGERFAAQHPRLGRYLRRLQREGVQLRRYDGGATALLRYIYRRKAEQRTDGANLFRDPLRIEFVLAAAAADPASFDVFAFEGPASLVAGLVTFRDRGVRRFYTVYFDPAWAHFSPGTTLVYEATRLSLAEGLDCDYMTGEQPHKMRLATCLVPLFQAEASVNVMAALAAGQLLTQLAA